MGTSGAAWTVGLQGHRVSSCFFDKWLHERWLGWAGNSCQNHWPRRPALAGKLAPARQRLATVSRLLRMSVCQLGGRLLA